mgnify:CR=1 FL=1
MKTKNQTGSSIDKLIPERSYGRSLPMLLMYSREVVMRRIRPHLRNHGLTDQQWRVLRALAEEEQLELLVLGQRCLIRPPSLSRIVSALIERGLVRRVVHPEDRRRVLISLTDKGRMLFEEVSHGSALIYEQLSRDIGEETLEEIYRVLINLIEVLEEGESASAPDEDI